MVAVLGIVGATGLGFFAVRERTGSPAPVFRLPSLGAGTVDLASFAGRVVVVNFWATWCPPCVEEMPSLERLHRALGPEGLAVLGVSVDDDEAALRRFVEEKGLTFPILRDPGGDVARRYRTVQYPETFVLDGAGIVRERYAGAIRWDAPATIDHFRGLLRSRTTSATR
jgi:peroxiredoxin